MADHSPMPDSSVPMSHSDRTIRVTGTCSNFNRCRLIQTLDDDSGRSMLFSPTASDHSDASSEHSQSLRHPRRRSVPTPEAPIWALKVTDSGDMLAAALPDASVRVWNIKGPNDHLSLDTPGPSLKSTDRRGARPSLFHLFQKQTEEESGPVMDPHPCRVFPHALPVLDLDWSLSKLLVTASMDGAVRVWHPEYDACLGVFEHPDIVTSVMWHPWREGIFVSGCMDGRIRVWSVSEKAMTAWQEVEGSDHVTAVGWVRNGHCVAAGTHTGRLVFYETDGLKYYTQLQIAEKPESAAKVTGIVVMPGSSGRADGRDERILVSCNDSRVYIYSMHDMSLFRKFKGHENKQGLIRATCSSDGRYIVSGSERQGVYVWRTDAKNAIQSSMPTVEWKALGRGLFLPKVRAPGTSYEKIHVNSTSFVTCAIFLPIASRQRLEVEGHRSPFRILRKWMGGPRAMSSDTQGRQTVDSDKRRGLLERMPTVGNIKDKLASFLFDNAEAWDFANGAILITADSLGRIRVYENRANLPKAPKDKS